MRTYVICSITSKVSLSVRIFGLMIKYAMKVLVKRYVSSGFWTQTPQEILATLSHSFISRIWLSNVFEHMTIMKWCKVFL